MCIRNFFFFLEWNVYLEYEMQKFDDYVTLIDNEKRKQYAIIECVSHIFLLKSWKNKKICGRIVNCRFHAK